VCVWNQVYRVHAYTHIYLNRPHNLCGFTISKSKMFSTTVWNESIISVENRTQSGMHREREKRKPH